MQPAVWETILWNAASINSVKPINPETKGCQNFSFDRKVLHCTFSSRTKVKRQHQRTWQKFSISLVPCRLCYTREHGGGCSSPPPRPWAHRWRTTNVCDTWPVRCQTYSYLPSCKESLLILLLLLLRLAPLRVHSATGCQQPPEWSVLGQVDCVDPRQSVGVEVVLRCLHPGHPQSSWWSLPIHWSLAAIKLYCLVTEAHVCQLPQCCTWQCGS